MSRNLKLDFNARYEKVGNSHAQEIYSKPLKEQYEHIKKRIPINRQKDELEEFLKRLFKPGMVGDFYIAAPNFEVEANESKSGIQYFNNVVIWPEYSRNMENILPNQRTMLFIGDIMMNPNGNNKMIIKSLDLFPSDIQGLGEKKLEGYYPIIKVTSTQWIGSGSGNGDCFTSSFMKQYVIDNAVTDEPGQFKKYLKNWEHYILFEDALLDEKLKHRYAVADVTYLEGAHEVSRRHYQNNRKALKPLLLDDLDLKVFGDRIIIKKAFEGADPFPLIKVVHAVKKKDIDESGNRKISYKSRLNAFTRDNVALSKKPSTTANGNGNAKPIQLGSRFLSVFRKEIEPDLTQLDEAETDAIHSYETSWQNKVQNQASEQLKQLKEKERRQQEARAEETLSAYEQTLPDPDQAHNPETLPKTVQKLLDDERKRLKRTKLEKEKKLRKSFKKSQSKSDKEKHQQSLMEKLETIEKDHETTLERLFSKDSVATLLKTHRDKKLTEKREALNKEIQRTLETLEKKEWPRILKETQNAHHQEHDDEIKAIRDTFETKRSKKIEDETMIAFTMYFRPFSESFDISENVLSDQKHLVFSDVAERSKLNRQRDALTNLKKGNMRNPFIASYLTASKALSYKDVDKQKLKWHLETLNEKQKESIQKILASKGIFLLQGPPGTGKTQVIAEAVAQLTAQGKKVVVASETHKAIDNVFERLPNNPGIRPLRLVAHDRKETRYEVHRLVDNLYDKMKGMMRDYKHRYDAIQVSLNEFKKSYNDVKLMIERYETISEKSRVDQDMIRDQEKQLKAQKQHLKQLANDKVQYNKEIDRLHSMKNESYFYYDQTESVEALNRLKKEGKSLISNTEWINENSAENPDDFLKQLLDQDFEWLEIIDWLETNTETTEKYNKLYQEFNDLYAERSKHRKRLLQIRKELNAIDVHPDLDKLMSFVSQDALTGNSFKTKFTAFQEQFNALMESFRQSLSEEAENVELNILNLDAELKKAEKEVDMTLKRIKRLDTNDDVKTMKNLQSDINQRIAALFNQWNIHADYDSFEQALEILEQTYSEKQETFDSDPLMKEGNVKIFEKVADYLEDRDVRDADRKTYTNTLFEQVNLIGITCTSRDSFDGTHLEDFKRYDIESLDLKEAGIDVVIIDEVSKSSFLELLIPLQYGQQIILVGDHRQLSPFYQHRHMKATDFDQLDNELLNEKANHKFKEIYEESYFKTLFMALDQPFKNMLERQYRSHSQIMDVYNHFYDGKLKLGYQHQDKDKQHAVRLSIEGIDFMTPDTSAYLIDNVSHENREEGSTSMSNDGERDVVVKLLDIINQSYIEKQGKESVSVGVITTYGDQARKIKHAIRNQPHKGKYSSFKKAHEDRFIISTVDDFQGDERDVIIVSMVRNPKNRRKADPSFIKQFERINVAFSRARKLLIIVGSKDYLSEYGKINLPNLDGNKHKDQKNYPVYEEIFKTISRHDGIFAADVLMKGGSS